jgi:hypothetical protein
VTRAGACARRVRALCAGAGHPSYRLVAAAFDGTAAPSFGEGLAMEEGGMVSGELVEQSLQFNGHTQRSEAALERAKKMLQTPWSPPWPFVRREEAAAGAVVKSISAARNSQNAVPPYDEDDVPEPRADYEEWDGPNGIRPEAPPYRMKTPAHHKICVMPDYIAGYGPREGGAIMRGSVLQMRLDHDDIKRGAASLVLVTEVLPNKYGGKEYCPQDYILPVIGVELWGKKDIEDLATTDAVPHAERFSASMRTCEVLQTVYDVTRQNRPLNVSKVLSIGSIVYDDEWLSTRGLFSDPENFWKGFQEQHFYFCTGVCKLHKLPCEWRDSRAKSARPAKARLELCVSALNFAPDDDDGEIRRHPRDLVIPTQYQEKKGGELISLDDSPPAAAPYMRAAGRRGSLAESASSATLMNVEKTQFPDQSLRKNAIGRWMAFSLVSNISDDPVQRFKCFAECERFHHGVLDWMHMKAIRKRPSEGSLDSDHYTTKTFSDISMSAILYMLYSTDALRFAEISFESRTREELKPASVHGGMRLTGAKAIEPAKPQSSLFELRLLVRNLDEKALQNSLRLPTLKNPYRHRQTGAEFHISCTDPSSPCPGICSCVITIREIMQKGEKLLQLEATNYRQGLRGDRSLVAMDMEGSQHVPGSAALPPLPLDSGVFPPLTFGFSSASVGSSDRTPARASTEAEFRERKKRKIAWATNEVKAKMQNVRVAARQMLSDYIAAGQRETQAWLASVKASLDVDPNFNPEESLLGPGPVAPPQVIGYLPAPAVAAGPSPGPIENVPGDAIYGGVCVLVTAHSPNGEK